MIGFTMKRISLNFKSVDKKFTIINDKYGYIFWCRNTKNNVSQNFIDEYCHLSELRVDKVASGLNKLLKC